MVFAWKLACGRFVRALRLSHLEITSYSPMTFAQIKLEIATLLLVWVRFLLAWVANDERFTCESLGFYRRCNRCISSMLHIWGLWIHVDCPLVGISYVSSHFAVRDLTLVRSDFGMCKLSCL